MKTESPVLIVDHKTPGVEYKRLAKVFRQDGFAYQELKRCGDVALYSKSKHGYMGFEVVVVRNREAYTIAGKTVEPGEVYPNSEAWGTLGWTFLNYDAAIEKFNRLKRSR